MRRGNQKGEEQGINWHWDKDEELRDQCDVVVNPYISTVTYLSSQGIPTVVVSARTDVEGTLVKVMLHWSRQVVLVLFYWSVAVLLCDSLVVMLCD